MTLAADAHVCFICPYIEPYLNPGSGTQVGGAERQQHLLGKYLRDEGHQVSFITFEGDGERYERIDGFDCWRTLPPTNDIKQTPSVLLKLLQSIRRVDADVFYVRGNPPLCILSSYSCSLLDKQLVYVIANDSNVEFTRLPNHHGVFKYTLPKLTYLDAIRRADHVVTQTSHQQNILGDVFGIDSTVIPNGYTIPDERELLPAEKRDYVLWVGTLDPDQKRPERFLELAESLSEVSFLMIGSTTDSTYQDRLVTRAEEIPNLRFEGFVPPDKIDQYYRNAVALVNTSEYEGFPNTYLEAWRFGVPVLSLHEMLDGVLSREGIGAHTRTMDKLKEHVYTCWNEREQVTQMGEAGRQYLTAHYALEVVAGQYMEIFGNLIAEKDSKGVKRYLHAKQIHEKISLSAENHSE